MKGFNYVQTNNSYQIELLELVRNTFNQWTVCKQISAYKIFANKSHMQKKKKKVLYNLKECNDIKHQLIISTQIPENSFDKVEDSNSLGNCPNGLASI